MVIDDQVVVVVTKDLMVTHQQEVLVMMKIVIQDIVNIQMIKKKEEKILDIVRVVIRVPIIQQTS